MRFRRKDPALPRLAFEARSVQLVAAWTLAMAGVSATQLPAPSRQGGTTAPHVSAHAPANALPPLTASLPRK